MFKDSKGFLWIGSFTAELSRFDGSVFKRYIPGQKRGAINTNTIYGFKEDSLHNIWMGTDKGISRYDSKADTFTNFPALIETKASPQPKIAAFYANRDEIYCLEIGSVITAFNIHTLKRRRVVPFSTEDSTGVQWNSDKSFFEAKSNSVWKLDYSKPVSLTEISLTDGKTQRYTWPCLFSNLKNHRHDAEDMVHDPYRNSIWINTDDGLVEFSLIDKQFHTVDALNQFLIPGDYDRFVGVDIDKSGNIWFATRSKGILIYDPKAKLLQPVFSDPDLQRKTAKDNLHIYCDRDGIVWTSTWGGAGIYEFLPYESPVKGYKANQNRKDSLSSAMISTIVPGPQGKMWIGTADGLNIFDPLTQTFEVLRQKDLPGIKGRAIIPLFVDTIRGKAWLNAGQQTDEDYFKMTMYVMDIKTRKCNRITFKDGSRIIDTFLSAHALVKPYKNGIIFCDETNGIFEVSEGSTVANLIIPFIPGGNGFGGFTQVEDRILILSHGVDLPNFTFENRNGKWIKIPHLFDSLKWSYIHYNKADKSYWASFRNELIHYDSTLRQIKSFGEDAGYNGFMLTMVMDDDGNLWFANMSGQIGRLNPISGVTSFPTEADGYYRQDYAWFVPSAKDANGDIYFGIGWKTGTPDLQWALNRIKPGRYSSLVTSSVYLQSIFINQKQFFLYKEVNALEEISLQYNQNTIRIEAGIIDFHSRKKGQIRYKLEQDGKQGDWQYPIDHTIRYENLPPGSYRLVIQSSNISKEFNSREKILMISISPPFWQTWWFRITAAVALLLLFYGIYRWRTATLRKQKRILEQTVKERTAEVVEEKAVIERQKDVIQSEKEKSDELLLNILPSEVAQELKEKGYTTARSFDEVTVLFSDIKGFTHVAEKLTAQELVKEIDTYFSAFDNIILKYGLEKIKTIGDAYIAAGGLPENNAATPQNVIEAAIAMQKQVEKLKQERIASNKPYFELRIGIHTGPVVAGVVGIKKFQYDIWGDTVNLAARMEQSGVPGKINISQQTYELVKGQFNCVHRGKIEAKNKGDIDMYFVE